MSILAAQTPPDLGLTGFLIAVGLVLVVITIAWAVRLFRPGSLNQPDRLPLDRPSWPFLVVMIVGFGIWFATQVVYGLVLAARQQMGPNPPVAFDESMLSGADFAFLSTVPPLAAMVALWVGDRILGRATVRGIGTDAAKIPAGLGWGALSMLLVLPLMLLLGMLLEQAYKWTGFEHPTAHQLLKILGESGQPLVRWMIILGATLGGPLFEELLFRGHLQTLIRRLCLWSTRREASAAGGFPVVAAPAPPAAAV